MSLKLMTSQVVQIAWPYVYLGLEGLKYEGMIESHLRFQRRTMIPSTQDWDVSKLDSSILVPERTEFDMKQIHSIKKLWILTL